MRKPPGSSGEGRLEGDLALATPVGEGEELERRDVLAGEHARVAVALPGDHVAAVLLEDPELDAVGRDRPRAVRWVEGVARDDRVADAPAVLLVVDGRGVAALRVVLAGADRLPAELRRVVGEWDVFDLL